MDAWYRAGRHTPARPRQGSTDDVGTESRVQQRFGDRWCDGRATTVQSDGDSDLYRAGRHTPARPRQGSTDDVGTESRVQQRFGDRWCDGRATTVQSDGD